MKSVSADKYSRKFKIFIGCSIFIIIGCLPTFPFAQSLEILEITSSPNPVGSGARALGMGGAFIAVANDATAASWNPGGLFQLQLPEVSIVGNAFHRIEDNEFGTHPEASGGQSTSKNSINYLSIAFPFNFLRRNMTVSVNYQNLYDFTREWNFPLIMDEERQYVDYKQDGSLSAFGIAYCIEITQEFSFGLTLNIWDDWLYHNEWEQKSIQAGSGIYKGYEYNFESCIFDRYSFKGVNLNLGTQWQLFSDKLTIGAVFKTPFEADLRHEKTYDSILYFPQLPEYEAGYEARTSLKFPPRDEKLDMPMSFGIGFAYRFSNGFTGALDIYRTEWDEFVLTDSKGNRTSPITGRSMNESNIDPTYHLRIGAEYFIITQKYEVPLRAGIFYDPAPAEGKPDDFFGFSLGSGFKAGRLDFDMAYQYRFGKDVGVSILPNWSFSQDIEEHSIYFSMIYHFGKRYFF